MISEYDITILAKKLVQKHDLKMKEALSIASQMVIAERLSEINEKISSIEYKFSVED